MLGTSDSPLKGRSNIHSPRGLLMRARSPVTHVEVQLQSLCRSSSRQCRQGRSLKNRKEPKMGTDLVTSAGEGGREQAHWKCFHFLPHVQDSCSVRVQTWSQYWQISLSGAWHLHCQETCHQQNRKASCNMVHISMLFIASPLTRTHTCIPLVFSWLYLQPLLCICTARPEINHEVKHAACPSSGQQLSWRTPCWR